MGGRGNSVRWRPLRSSIRAAATGVRAALTIATSYLGLLTVAAVVARSRRATAHGSAHHRFIVLIAAHDEERLITQTVGALQALDYPEDRYCVHVVADNCGDDTVALARQAGAVVHERTAPDAPGKGPALEWLLARLRSSGEAAETDVLVIIDADTLVDRNFLRAVDERLVAGAAVVQGHYAVRDVQASPTVALGAAAFAARTYLRPLGRCAIGGSAGLHGNGMAFRSDVLAAHRWTDHLTEDVELSLELLLSGTLVDFAPLAMVRAELPTTLESARSQHQRWERGRLEVARRYVPALTRRAITGGRARRVAFVDAALDQVVPPFSILVVSSSAWAMVAGVRTLLRPSQRARRDLVCAATVAGAQAGYLLVALALVRAPRHVYRALLQAPQFVVWKLGLWFGIWRPDAEVHWTRTARN